MPRLVWVVEDVRERHDKILMTWCCSTHYDFARAVIHVETEYVGEVKVLARLEYELESRHDFTTDVYGLSPEPKWQGLHQLPVSIEVG